MKIIHTADIHLGSKIERKLDREKSEERKREVRTAFDKIIDYARKEGVSAIILAGDVFDSVRPLKKDKEFFYNAVKANENIDFLYLRGNHDVLESYTENLPNLKTFEKTWTSYAYGNVVITGAELCGDNFSSAYSTLSLKKDDINVVTLHGQISDGAGENLINLKKLKDKNIDYLALGHIHSYKSGAIDGRGEWAYPGCPEGRGFDETGAKGFILLDVNGDKIEKKFIENSIRKINDVSVDVSGAKDVYTAGTIVKERIDFNKNDLYRIRLTGEISFDAEGIEKDVAAMLAPRAYYITVKDETIIKTDISDYEGDVSVRGEFIRKVLNSDYTPEEKQAVITCGLKALAGREDI